MSISPLWKVERGRAMSEEIKTQTIEIITRDGNFLIEVQDSSADSLLHKLRSMRFKPTESSSYFIINELGEVEQKKWTDSQYDNLYLEMDNVYYSLEEAEERARELSIVNRINRRRKILNQGWQPDWEDTDDDKYVIYCSRPNFNFDIISGEAQKYDYAPVFGYFKSEATADLVISEFYEDLVWYFGRGTLHEKKTKGAIGF